MSASQFPLKKKKKRRWGMNCRTFSPPPKKKKKKKKKRATNPPNSDMDYGIFNVHTDVNACDCTWGCADTARESALKADSGRKIPCRTGESNLRRRRAGLMLYQLSYIPSPLTSPSNSLVCLIEIYRAVFSSGTRQCPTVESKSVCCSHGN